MMDDEERPTSLRKSFSARLRRKEQVARGEAVPEMPEDSLPPGIDEQTEEPDEEAALSDEELLAKYGVDDPDAIEDEDKLDDLLQGQFPDRIRQMALRRMWRLNPLFRFADEMVEYGENYTDAATVIEGMQTAYQVGKGYLQKAFDAVDDDAADAAAAGGEAQSLVETPEKTRHAGEPSQPDGDDGAGEKLPEDDVPPDHKSREMAAGEAVNDDAAPHSAAGEAVQLDAPPVSGTDIDDVPPPPRPRRMTFRRPGE